MVEIEIKATSPAKDGKPESTGVIVTNFPDIESEAADFDLAWEEVQTLADRGTLLFLIKKSFFIDVQRVLRGRLAAGKDYSDINGVKPGQEFKAVAVDPQQAALNYVMSLTPEKKAEYIRAIKESM